MMVALYEASNAVFTTIELDDLLEIILDRREAIGKAIAMAQPGDAVVITGKGSEISMAIAGNRKIPWSDRDIAKSFLSH